MTKRTFAVGDIQGCYDSLRCLLDKAAFNAKHDQLWVVGDLVNRGPQSLATLRYLKDLGKHAKIVLGNHDLHLLAIASGAHKIRKNDTFADVLGAPDRTELLDWLRRQPLLHHDAKLGFTMVHAGIPPGWTLQRAQHLAAEVEQRIQGKKADDFFANMYGAGPRCWDDKLSGNKRLRCIVNYFTRMRFCTAEGKLDLKDKASTESSRPGYLPWFQHSKRRMQREKIVFGHWAALQGKAKPKNVYALDTGCAWGGKLTLLQLENKKLFSCNCSSS